MTDTAVPRIRLPETPVGAPPRRGPSSWGARRVLLVALAGAVLVAALAGLGPDALVAFGLLLAFSADIDEEDSGRAVVATPRNIALTAVMGAVFAWFWVERLALSDLGLLVVGAALIAMPLALQEAPAGPARRRAVWVTRRNLVLAVSGAVIFVYLYFAYGENFNMLVTTCVVLPLVLAVSRAWRGTSWGARARAVAPSATARDARPPRSARQHLGVLRPAGRRGGRRRHPLRPNLVLSRRRPDGPPAGRLRDRATSPGGAGVGASQARLPGHERARSSVLGVPGRSAGPHLRPGHRTGRTRLAPDWRMAGAQRRSQLAAQRSLPEREQRLGLRPAGRERKDAHRRQPG